MSHYIFCLKDETKNGRQDYFLFLLILFETNWIHLFCSGFFESEKGFFDNSENLGPGFLNGERKKFNFNENGKNPEFPGDARNDIPALPQIETSEDKEPNVQSGFKSIHNYFTLIKHFKSY